MHVGAFYPAFCQATAPPAEQCGVSLTFLEKLAGTLDRTGLTTADVARLYLGQAGWALLSNAALHLSPMPCVRRSCACCETCCLPGMLCPAGALRINASPASHGARVSDSGPGQSLSGAPLPPSHSLSGAQRPGSSLGPLSLSQLPSVRSRTPVPAGPKSAGGASQSVSGPPDTSHVYHTRLWDLVGHTAHVRQGWAARKRAPG